MWTGCRIAFRTGARIAIVGGGYIGLEVAAVGAKRGLDVTVFEAMDRLMARAVSPELSAFYAAEHEKAGVKLKLKTGVEAIEGNGKVERVIAGGQRFATPTWCWWGSAWCHAMNWRLMPGWRRKTALWWTRMRPAIRTSGRRAIAPAMSDAKAIIRLECVQNAIDQAKHAALAMVGKPRPTAKCPGSGRTSMT
jgi:3-phenylpropionate/trans-cinnamate dioxygenase ferredoxin reductase subunit